MTFDLLPFANVKAEGSSAPGFAPLAALCLLASAFAALGAPIAAHARASDSDPYGSRSIRAGAFLVAERKLNRGIADDEDPARLINLARVYLATHRLGMAHDALLIVRRLPDEELILDNGSTANSHLLAGRILAAIPPRSRK